MPYKLTNAAARSYTCASAEHTPRFASAPVLLGKLLELLKPNVPKCPTCGSKMTLTGMTVQLPLDSDWIHPKLWAQAKAALTALGAR